MPSAIQLLGAAREAKVSADALHKLVAEKQTDEIQRAAAEALQRLATVVEQLAEIVEDQPRVKFDRGFRY
jgi:hypothetical protein